MDKIIFTEEFCQPENLHPFTLTRQIQDIRVGLFTIREKWERVLGLDSFDKQEDDYKDLDRSITIQDAAKDGGICYMIHGNVLPTAGLVKKVKKLRNGEFVSVKGGEGIVYRFTEKEIRQAHQVSVKKAIPLEEELRTIRYPWDIVQLNDWAIREDIALLGRKKKWATPSKTNRLVKPGAVFIEKGAKVEHAIINAEAGPVYIGKDALVMEGCLVRGPFALGEGSVLKMGTKIYGPVSTGPGCVLGGEVKNSVVFGYSNKAHDGYLGDSVVGEWCNMGAGTSNSNLKNTAGEVKVWTSKGEKAVGQKCGVMMGDYSRTAINTSINTGTVIGTCSHVFGSGLTPRYIPSFSWGSEGVRRYEWEKALKDMDSWKKMKGKSLTENEIKILDHVYKKF